MLSWANGLPQNLPKKHPKKQFSTVDRLFFFKKMRRLPWIFAFLGIFFDPLV